MCSRPVPGSYDHESVSVASKVRHLIEFFFSISILEFRPSLVFLQVQELYTLAIQCSDVIVWCAA